MSQARPGVVSEVQDQTIITQRGRKGEWGVCVREKEANELDSLGAGIKVMQSGPIFLHPSPLP